MSTILASSERPLTARIRSEVMNSAPGSASLRTYCIRFYEIGVLSERLQTNQIVRNFLLVILLGSRNVFVHPPEIKPDRVITWKPNR